MLRRVGHNFNLHLCAQPRKAPASSSQATSLEALLVKSKCILRASHDPSSAAGADGGVVDCLQGCQGIDDINGASISTVEHLDEDL